MAACLGMGDSAGAMRTTPRASSPPAALAAPPVIAVCDASGIEMAGGDVKGVAQQAPTSLHLRTVDETVQMAAAASAARVGTAVCTPNALPDLRPSCNPHGSNGTGHCQPLPERHHCYGG